MRKLRVKRIVSHFLSQVLVATFALMSSASAEWGPYKRQENTVAYNIIAKDGTRHTLTVKYEFSLSYNRWDDGRISSFSHPIDTRECQQDFSVDARRTIVSSRNVTRNVEENIRQPYSGRFDYTASGMRDISNVHRILHAGGVFDIIDFGARTGSSISNIAGAVGELESGVTKEELFNVVASIVIGSVDGTRNLALLLGNAISRFVTLGKGPNCGDAANVLNSELKVNFDIGRPIYDLRRQINYYVQTIEIWKNWGYWNESKGAYVEALVVYPATLDRKFDAFATAQALMVAKDVMGRSPDHETVVAIEAFVKNYHEWHEPFFAMLADRKLDRIRERMSVARSAVSELIPLVAALPLLPESDAPLTGNLNRESCTQVVRYNNRRLLDRLNAETSSMTRYRSRSTLIPIIGSDHPPSPEAVFQMWLILYQGGGEQPTWELYREYVERPDYALVLKFSNSVPNLNTYIDRELPDFIRLAGSHGAKLTDELNSMQAEIEGWYAQTLARKPYLSDINTCTPKFPTFNVPPRLPNFNPDSWLNNPHGPRPIGPGRDRHRISNHRFFQAPNHR